MTLIAGVLAFDSVILIILLAVCEPYFEVNRERKRAKDDKLYNIKPK